MSEAVPEPAVANVLDYVAAWNEPDAATRLKILERCWADDGAYVDPNVELRGRSALSEHISTVQAGRPGARIEMLSGVDLHHHVVRFLWRLVRADGERGVELPPVGARRGAVRARAGGDGAGHLGYRARPHHPASLRADLAGHLNGFGAHLS